MISQPLAATTAAGTNDLPFWQQPEVWLLVAFAIFVGLMARPVWTKITGGLDDRAARIRAELDEARKLREEAQAALAKYQRKQRDATKEAEEILQHAEQKAKQLTTEAEATLEATLARREALARERIAQSQTRAIEQVKDEVVEVALAVTKALIEENMDTAKGENLLDAAVKDLPGKLQ